MNPFFSIIIPTYNRSNTILLTINSVLKQSFVNYEIIVVDDGSTDDTRSVISNFINSSEIRYIRQTNKGVSSARNYGAHLSKGKYLAFLDSDDSVSNSWLIDAYEKINCGQADIILCDMMVLEKNKRPQIKKCKSINDKHNCFGIFMPGSFYISKKFFNLVGGYDENIKYGENMELCFRICKLNPISEFIEKPNFIYNRSLNGESKNWKNKLDSTLYVLQKHAEYFSIDNRVHNLYLGVASLAAYKCNKPVLARVLFLKSFIIAPFKFKSWVRFFIFFVPFIAFLRWGRERDLVH